MAEILGLVMTHYLPLAGRDENMAGILRTTREPRNPRSAKAMPNWNANSAWCCLNVLADGLLSGTVTTEPVGHMVAPRMQGEFHSQPAITSFLKKMAAARGCTPAQLAVAWLIHRGEDLIPIIGMSRRSRPPETLAIANVTFTANELAALERAFAPDAIRGDRYRAIVMKYAAQ